MLRVRETASSESQNQYGRLVSSVRLIERRFCAGVAAGAGNGKPAVLARSQSGLIGKEVPVLPLSFTVFRRSRSAAGTSGCD